ncbi:hypothetical protein DKX38_026807 [Salix brachista]|uniref:Uncharacterized protein n=1 Tax=Salix brachista TaxID=2182728 RepID=A0A5N5JAF0_9ROSI|nr:hypothetical protein DKX38_026807 [Salix brachista]
MSSFNKPQSVRARENQVPCRSATATVILLFSVINTAPLYISIFFILKRKSLSLALASRGNSAVLAVQILCKKFAAGIGEFSELKFGSFRFHDFKAFSCKLSHFFVFMFSSIFCRICLISLFDVLFYFLPYVTYDFLNLLRDWRIFRVEVWIF